MQFYVLWHYRHIPCFSSIFLPFHCLSFFNYRDMHIVIDVVDRYGFSALACWHGNNFILQSFLGKMEKSFFNSVKTSKEASKAIFIYYLVTSYSIWNHVRKFVPYFGEPLGTISLIIKRKISQNNHLFYTI